MWVLNTWTISWGNQWMCHKWLLESVRILCENWTSLGFGKWDENAENYWPCMAFCLLWCRCSFECSSVFNVIWDESLYRVKAISLSFISSLSVQFSALTTPQGCFACLFQRLRLRSKKKATHKLNWDRSEWGTHGSLHTHTTVFQFRKNLA